MKLVIVIPAYNEEDHLPVVFKELPKSIQGIDKIETLVINDGSTDQTKEIAQKYNADKIISFKSNQGLAKGFQTGLMEASKMGADVIVIFDADNQYRADNLENLIQPIIEKKADIVVGSRPINKIKHFSWFKKVLQRLGSLIVRRLSKLDIPDTTSGFRAYSREAALRLVIVSKFTYTLESLIQARKKGLTVTSVPINVNDEVLRESRLFKSKGQYIIRSLDTMLRTYFMYQPYKVFGRIGAVIFLVALGISFRFLYFYFTVPPGQNAGHIQSLILAAILFIIGSLMIVIGFVTDLIYHNRKYIEEILYYQRKNEL